MADHLFDENHYVLLMHNCPEEFVTAAELATFLGKLLEAYPAALDADVMAFPTAAERVERLMQTTCELDIGPGESVQWYAVRLNKR